MVKGLARGPVAPVDLPANQVDVDI